MQQKKSEFFKNNANAFVSDMEAIRERARAQMLDGAVVSADKDFVEETVRILNEALATEIVCTLRYTAHYYAAEGIHADAVKKEFKEHADEERMHAEMIAERIKQLNGQPNFNPEGIMTRSHSDFESGETLVDLIKEDLFAERIAIETYKEIIAHLSGKDITTCRLMEKILENEEEHADEMADLLKTLDPSMPSQK